MRRFPVQVMAVALAALCLAASGPAPVAETAGADDDPYLWLEEVESDKALEWAREQNERTLPVLEKVKEFEPIMARALEILDSDDRIAWPDTRGDHIYNFWQDDEHVRGIWRRTTLESYRTDEPTWETVIDLDELTEKDGIPWVWKGADCLPPEHSLCMVSLSRGGSDATFEKEFDTRTKQFVEGGFSLPEAKSSVSWRDENTLWVGTNFGEGSLTDSGYPRVVKLWTRGRPLSEAKTIYQGSAGDVGAYGFSMHMPGRRYDGVFRIPAFFKMDIFLYLDDRLVKLDLPEDIQLRGIFRDHLLVSLRSDWETGGASYPQGALLSIGMDDFLLGRRSFEVLFEPSQRTSLEDVSITSQAIVLTVLDNVRSKLIRLEPSEAGWKRGEIALPGLGTARVVDSGPWQDRFAYSYNDFLTPSSLFMAKGGSSEKIKTSPAFFDAEGMEVSQHEATSRDGTKIPYFMVVPKGYKADGKNPTLLYGYGGFEVSMLPRYRATVGSAWVERGGVYVLANIRGGGEFGPRWHEAALKEKRIKSFEDFIAVGEDLVARKVTSPEHLGIVGGSQGGLLVGGAMTLRPDLFGAVVSQVPLADMRRFNKLLAGASWMAEYGNPDVPEEWAYIKTWSPYHLLRKDADYPTPYFWTNTRDDRVHPGHARKMVARMMEMGHPVYYFENIEGGHGSGSVNKQRAYTIALEYAYLWKMLD